jgi:hypothetical protein
MKGYTLLFLSVIACLSSVLLFVSSTAASSGWSRIYQGGPLDAWFPFSVIQTSDGGYAMVVFANARYIDNVGYEGHFTTQYELYLIKMDASGNVQWKQTFTKSDDPNSQFYSVSPIDYPYTLVQTFDGGYAIAGQTGNHAFWLFKVNSQGTLLWSKTYGTASEAEFESYSDSLYSMIQTKDGGFALAGSTEAFTANQEGGRDFWLVKVDSEGTEQWNQGYNSGTYTDPSGDEYPRYDEAKSVIQTSDGGYVLSGQTTTYVSLSSTYETWMVKTDSLGKQQWTKTYSGPNDAGTEYRVIQTSDGGFALATSEVRDFDFTVIQLIRTDSSGEVQWRNTYGDNKDPDVTWYVNKYINAPCAVVQLNDGGFAVAGTMTEGIENGPISHNLGLLRVDSAGNMLWTKMYNARENLGTLSEEWAYSMTRTSDGGYAIVGTTESSWDGSHVDAFFVKTESLEQPPEQSPPPQPQSLDVSDVSGSVKVQSPEQGDTWTQANSNASLSQGSKIKTEENGGTLKLGNTTTLEIQPNTLIEVEALTGDSSTLLLQEGEFTADVTGLPSGGSLKVDMSQAVAEITGTVFTVTETGTESTLRVKEGSVAFTSKVDGETVTVAAGEKVTATAEGLGSTLTETGTSDTSTLIIAVAVVVSVVLIIVAILGIKRRKLRKTKEP